MKVKKKFLSVIAICFMLVLQVRANDDANNDDDDDENYMPADEMCDRCNCSSSDGTLEDSESGVFYTIDCSMKNFQHLFAKWPAAMGDNHSAMEVVYIMSFNDLHKLQQLPSTEALILFTCRHCKIAEIDNEAFIDTKNIKLLDLAYNELTSSSLNSDIFRGPYNDDEYSPIMLESLDLSHNQIDSLDKFVFEHTPHLKKLDLSFNELKTIEEGSAIALSNLHNLEILDLSHTAIDNLPEQIFENMQHLSELFLNGNNLLSVPESLSRVGESLEYLHLSNNPIAVIKTESLANLIKLEHLNISGMTELTTIEMESFSSLHALEALHCRGNKQLALFDMESLLALKHLKELDISNNNLMTLDFGKYVEIEKFKNAIVNKNESDEFFKHLHVLKLAGNPWKCDCKMMKAMQFFNHNATYFKKTANNDEARCSTPYDLASKLLYELPLHYICVADQKSAKEMKFPVYEPPQFLRPKSIMLTVFSVLVVVVAGVIIGFIIVCIKRRLKSNDFDNSNPIRYTAVRDSTISNIGHHRNTYQQQP